MPYASRHFAALRIATLAVAVLVAGCSITPTEPEPDPDRVAAEEARAAGDPGAAARRYAAAADAASPPDSALLRLTAAWFHLEADETDRASALLEEVEIDGESPDALVDLHHAVRARLRLVEDDITGALALVDERLPSDTVAARELLQVKALALALDERHLASAEVRAAVDELLPTEWERGNNRDALWRSLDNVPMSRLRDIVPPPPDTFGAWLELNFLARSQRFDPPTLEESLRLWKERYPDHPAADDDLRTALLDRYLKSTDYPEHVAVLIPLSGDLAAAGRAIRDGMLAGYYASDRERPVLTFHDVGENGDDPWSTYLQVAQEGASLVIGPLTRPAVEVFAQARSLPVPVLALNGSSNQSQPPSGLYRFGLLPEDDARAAARHAYTTGMRHVAVLVPDGDWGRRVEAAFEAELENLGGVVVAAQRYSESSQDHAFSLRRLFSLDDSGTREQRLRSTIGRSVETTPRRRQDIDAVFVGAFPDQARVIRPQIRFHQGTALPVLTTSHAYDGSANGSDSDLIGVTFFDTPWSLGESTPTVDRPRMEQLMGGSLGRYSALYGLGIDAYRLIPELNRLRADSQERMTGATGDLWIDDSGHVRRDLRAARFQRDGVGILGNGDANRR